MSFFLLWCKSSPLVLLGYVHHHKFNIWRINNENCAKFAHRFVHFTSRYHMCHMHEKNWTTRFSNHMNKGRLNSESRSWNKKIKRKNMTCAWCERKRNLFQNHDNNKYPKLMLNILKVVWNFIFIYTYWAPSSRKLLKKPPIYMWSTFTHVWPMCTHVWPMSIHMGVNSEIWVN
jgi:hypothetical protein